MNEEVLVRLCWGEADVLVSAAGGLLQLQLNVNTHFLHVHFCFKTFPGNIFKISLSLEKITFYLHLFFVFFFSAKNRENTNYKII